jgi:16S rRNA (adenine1518-N6/adenine1519-N6)-dimethyltransferase
MSDIHRARKRFGQNFLSDPGIIHHIARHINAKADEHLVEIGPGKGALTADIIDSGCRLDVIELDRDLVPILLAQFVEKPGFKLHQGDALKFDFAQLHDDGKPLRVIGNLPYNISTPLLFHLLDNYQLIADMHFMLQLEVVLRLAAPPGHKNYGRLSVMAQYFCQVDQLFEVPPEAFSPRPKVQSAIVRLVPHKQLPHPADDLKTLEAVLRESFNQRRKTLRNSLKNLISSDELASIGIDPAGRPEKLSLEEFVRISNHISRMPKDA